jgi:hypothetical protein
MLAATTVGNPNKALDESKAYLGSKPTVERNAWINEAKLGKVSSDPKQQTAALALRTLFNDAIKAVHYLGT